MSRPTAIVLRRDSGFTMIELLAAVSVLAVLLAIGVPAFTETIRNNRVVAQTNELILSLNMARSEASKRGLAVTLCAANSDQSACAGATASDWANGWLLFTDAAGTAGVVDGTDAVIQRSQSVTPGLQLTSNSLGFIRYGRGGAPTNSATIAIGTAAIAFGLQHQSCSGTGRRVITVDRTGRANLTKVTCT